MGSGRETRMRDLAEQILAVTNSPAEILFTPRNDPGVSRMWADIQLAKDLLGYEPKTDLETGLRRTLEQDERFAAVAA